MLDFFHFGFLWDFFFRGRSRRLFVGGYGSIDIIEGDIIEDVWTTSAGASLGVFSLLCISPRPFCSSRKYNKMSITGDEVDRCVIKAAAEEQCAPSCVKEMEAYNG